ncbi:MAG: hypothetical protein A2998_00500 [Candidatus Staskawiczbacteria bacterium RIFCSPLOWO2_01_FULL_37_25b]|uniref:Uncharacterized protein n=2 Tax=Candidatus Staskawicziibacteriota TaxID=1817916 RepID=A0A1G2HJM8_9BACT|nr:MAG: hypothetical protein A2812_00440 [Candidatus Staskawiczbacteria bacterium RIFCSPHIGHO2_01_FULL_36_16]OGZ71778.1 MAG: hypothetical protein A2998_00500 [Candidatus Staskawiczbacteria bacterium RIFCSPLOWO2_01_FULL_37_25b]
MPNGHLGNKEYGPHEYAGHEGTSDCKHGCGCWMGPSRSGGPVGLDPFGKCPKNPEDGNLLGGNEDYNGVVNQRIEELTSRMQRAEERLKRVSPTKKQMAEEIASLKKQLYQKDRILTAIRAGIGIEDKDNEAIKPSKE